MRMSRGAVARRRKVDAHLEKQERSRGKYKVTRITPYMPGKSYPFSSTGECARRTRQIAEGRLTAANGFVSTAAMKEAT
jgi:hypothetical protein